MGEGISDYTRFVVDLRRQMWMAGVEEELRRLIWQIAVTGKYISAKIHESNRKLAGFKNLYGEDQLSLDRSSDEILKNQLQFSGFVREYASEEQDAVVLLGKGREKYFVTADPLDGSSLVDTNLAIGTIIGIHKESIFSRGRDSMVAALYITYGPLITMVYSAGKGTHEFVLNREGEYVLSEENIMLEGARLHLQPRGAPEGLHRKSSEVSRISRGGGIQAPLQRRIRAGHQPGPDQTGGDLHLSRAEEEPPREAPAAV